MGVFYCVKTWRPLLLNRTGSSDNKTPAANADGWWIGKCGECNLGGRSWKNCRVFVLNRRVKHKRNIRWLSVSKARKSILTITKYRMSDSVRSVTNRQFMSGCLEWVGRMRWHGYWANFQFQTLGRVSMRRWWWRRFFLLSVVWKPLFLKPLPHSDSVDVLFLFLLHHWENKIIPDRSGYAGINHYSAPNQQ